MKENGNFEEESPYCVEVNLNVLYKKASECGVKVTAKKQATSRKESVLCIERKHMNYKEVCQ